MSYFADLEQELVKYLDTEQIDIIYQAYLVAREAHEGQKRLSGEPYIIHPVAAATILAEMRMDYQSIVATLLHDVLEDTQVSKEELQTAFGEEVAELVDGVSKLTQIKFESRAQAQAENFRKMVLAMVRDIRVILVKLADRLHNMRTIGHISYLKRRYIALETLEIYAPIANRLGMHALYIELEDLAFQALHPFRYRVLQSELKKARGNRRQIMKEIKETLEESLKKHNVEYLGLQSRQKHLYSIYKKMRRKHRTFAEIMDVYGFRIIVPSQDDCYRTLGIVHNTYKPRLERFKDYIAIPKINAYQSLHTTLHGPYGIPLEVQIRSQDMNLLADKGIAAHWLYKSTGLNFSEAQVRVREWIKSLLEIQQNVGNSIEFIESVKIDLFPDEIYVFTPKGDILELPRGATPVDLAYLIHSDIGNTCISAKIDRRLSVLNTSLRNGQVVEIITSPNARPNPAWLNFVTTGKARSNIRHYLKTSRAEEAIALGKRLLQQSLYAYDKKIKDFDEETVNKLAKKLSYKKASDLYQAMGLGNEVGLLVARHLLEKNDLEKTLTPSKARPLIVKGTEGMIVKFAECCHPIPGDPIVGYLTAGQGLKIHVEQCSNVKDFPFKPETYVQLTWENKIKGQFLVNIEADIVNEPGVLAEITRAIADTNTNIDNIRLHDQDGSNNLVKITLVVKNRVHLARVMKCLKRIRRILKIRRERFKQRRPVKLRFIENPK